MLERTLEPEVMDSALDAIEYNRMDHSAVNVKFVDELLVFLANHDKRLRVDSDPLFDELDDPDVIGSLLDVGTGTALIPIELCKRESEVRVMGIDLAVSMLDLAIQNIDIAGLRSQIQLAQIDAKDCGYEDEMFDAVISNSIIHHIPDPKLTFSESVRVCRSQGLLFFRDLLRPETDEEVSRLVETYAGEEADHARKMFDDSLRAAFTVSEIQAFVSDLGFSPDTVQATSDRHWTWKAVKP